MADQRGKIIWLGLPVATLGLGLAIIATIVKRAYAHACNNPTSVSITSPGSGFCYMNQTVTITASASDQDGLSKIDILINGVVKNTCYFTCSGTTSGTCSYNWDTSLEGPSCSVSIAARATDCCSPPNVTTSAAVTGQIDRTVPASVTITSPSSSFCYSNQTVNIAASASDNCTVSKMEIWVGTTLKHVCNFACPGATGQTCSYSWDTSQEQESCNVVISATATDCCGNQRKATTVSGQIDRTGPSVSITSPGSGFCYKDQVVDITASATDVCSVSKIEILINDVVRNTCERPCPAGASYTCSYTWNTADQQPLCNISIKARAYDCCGNVTTSAAVTGKVDRTAPTVSISSPADGATVCDSTTVTAACSDDCAVTNVELFSADAAGGPWSSLGTCGTCPCSKPFTGLSGTKYLKARATDCSQNVADSSVISVNIVRADLVIAGLGEAVEENPGAFICLNDDDNNTNDIQDLNDSGTVTGENDLVSLSLVLLPATLNTGTLTLSKTLTGTGDVKVWESATKGTQVTLPKTWTVGTDTIPSTLTWRGSPAAPQPSATWNSS